MARMVMAEHMSISQEAAMPRSLSSLSSTQGQTRR